ncbi:Activator of Hsp90 ATPase, N-terminal [Dillenia turbinata]|uniref:Activator of Hsp90 ATPase, N-terminal n=1 Tax=Dillenia turbinata TaxID=194707 RepID=A0AAN8WDN0_9MAGN
MEGGAITSSMEKEGSSSYTYWVREVKREEAAPLPVPRKLTTPHDLSSCSSKPSFGSAWNHAGTWEEKNLNKWASDKIKELLVSMESIEFSGGKADVTDVTKCVGDAFLVTVRNKKRVGYTYELTLKVKGEWYVGDEKKVIKGHLDVPEFSLGELDDLQMEVRLSEDKDLSQEDKKRIIQDLKQFLWPLREKLLQFEEELKDR